MVAKHLVYMEPFLPASYIFFTMTMLYFCGSCSPVLKEKKILNLGWVSDGKKISFHGFLPEVSKTQIHKGGCK